MYAKITYAKPSRKDIVNIVYCMWAIPIFDNKEIDRGIKFCIIAAINSRIISICLRTEENNGRYNRLKTPLLLLLMLSFRCNAAKEHGMTS